jgi:uncharacterized protein
MELIPRYFHPPQSSFFLFGPRGTGKSTFARQSYSGSLIIDLLDTERVRFPVFTKRAKRQQAVHPKFFLFDTGFYRALRPKGPLDHPEEIEGLALEGLVGQHLRAWIAYSKTKRELFFWRTRSGVEVDFVIYGEDGIWAVEVKNSQTIRPADLRSLRSFQEDYPKSKTILLYRGKDRLIKGNTLCMPCADFLAALHPRRPLDLFPAETT